VRKFYSIILIKLISNDFCSDKTGTTNSNTSDGSNNFLKTIYDSAFIVSHHKRSPSSITKNITRMVLVSLLVNVIGLVPFSVCFIFSTSGVNTALFNTVNIATIFVLLISPSVDFFSYYFFNKLFKSAFNENLKKIKKIFLK